MQQNENCTKHNSEIIHACMYKWYSLSHPNPPPPTYKFEIDNYGKVNIAHRGGEPGLFWGYGLYVNNHHRQDLQIDNNAKPVCSNPNP